MRLRLLQLSLRALAHGQARPHLDSPARRAEIGPSFAEGAALAAVLLDRFNQAGLPQLLAELAMSARWPPTKLGMIEAARRFDASVKEAKSS